MNCLVTISLTASDEDGIISAGVVQWGLSPGVRSRERTTK